MEVQAEQTAEATTTSQEEVTTTERDSQSQQTTKTQESTGDDLGWTDEQKAYIDGLRKENAKYRTRAKERDSEVQGLNERLGRFETGLKKLFGDEESDMTPEEQVEILQAHNEQLAVQSALKEAAFEYGIGRDDYEYFEFMVAKRLGELEEGEELTEDDLDDIANMARQRSGAPGTTSVEGGDPPPPDQQAGGVTLEEFMEMGIGQKSVLYQKDRKLYETLSMQERAAKKKR